MRRAPLLLVLFGCQPAVPPPEGVYTMCGEVAGYSGETIELRDGRFRYWFYSDVAAKDEPSYPLTGRYTVSGRVVTLEHPKIYQPSRVLAKINGIDVLWRDDGLAGWEKDGGIHPYAVLLRVEGARGNQLPGSRPSIETLKPPLAR